MSKKLSVLANINVAAPCPASWDKMTGDARVRFCGECKLNVYNLSDMSESEAEALILEKEGRLCVRYFRRQDGTILTDNCPVGLRRIRNFGRRVAAVIALTISSVITLGNQTSAEDKACPPTMGAPVRSDEKAEHLMGDISSPPALTAPDSPYCIDLAKLIAVKWLINTGPIANIRINRLGIVESVTIEKSSGDPSTDADAVRVIKTAKIPPFPKWCQDNALTFTIDLSK